MVNRDPFFLLGNPSASATCALVLPFLSPCQLAFPCIPECFQIVGCGFVDFHGSAAQYCGRARIPALTATHRNPCQAVGG